MAAATEEADCETAAGADDGLPWRKDKDLGDAMPWLAALQSCERGATLSGAPQAPAGGVTN